MVSSADRVGPARLGDHRPHAVGGTHRHGGFIDHQAVAVDMLADGGGHRQHMLEVGGAVFTRRGAHGYEQQGAEAHGLVGVGGERQAALFAVARQHGFQSGLVDGHFAAVQGAHPLDVHIGAQHLMPHIRQAGGGDQADIAGAEHGDTHRQPPGARFEF